MMHSGNLKISIALAGLAQWIERQPADSKVQDSIPVKGMYLVAGTSAVEVVQEAADR